MTTAAQAYSVIRTRLENNTPAGITQLRWQNVRGEPLPDTPAPFVYTEFLTDPARLVSFGGGAGANRYRHPGQIHAYVFVPRGQGLSNALTIAEQIATLFRSYRDSDISCFEATIYPGGDGASLAPKGMSSEVNNYFWSLVVTSMFFDLIG